ncbi:NUDIX domain-containing protein [Segetibacter sp. 3557_3]|uniref:NUDIX domain-containing protein n=1 Tax=Segetibacter sp. 3557_3 TaxID=2547429 RepID=UPI001058ACC1|nr:NUDIX domain-containing protein [Segetibacter sp. 3557_3]TDH28523.1 NUDIX domain-containing protein [Segetibacter sp. 3557_3]
MKQSAGILAYRLVGGLEIFLVHPGGPFFRNKDLGAWSIPKGEFEDGEQPLETAKREFYEETGHEPQGTFFELQPVKLKSGKVVFAWAVEQQIDERALVSNTFLLEWPPRSGKRVAFPEVDKAAWFSLTEARTKINPAQADFLDQLASRLQDRNNS